MNLTCFIIYEMMMWFDTSVEDDFALSKNLCFQHSFVNKEIKRVVDSALDTVGHSCLTVSQTSSADGCAFVLRTALAVAIRCGVG